MEGKYAAVIVQTRVKECFSRDDVVDNFARTCKIIATSVRHHYFGVSIPNRLAVFDSHAHNHGYSVQEMIGKIAIEIPGKDIQVVVDTAKKSNVYIVTSALEYDSKFPESFFTCYFVVDPKGDVIYKYRKVHIHYGTEKTLSPYDVMDRYYEVYGKGKSVLQTFFPVADTPLGRIGALIAHDRIYPEAARAFALNGAEILVMGPQPEPSVAGGRWETMNRARAFENMVYVLAANYGEFVSEERASQRWAGHSMIVDFEGRITGSAPYPGEAVCAGTIDIEALRERRADPYDSPLAEMRNDIYRQIYADSIYPKNRLATSGPAETAKERMAFFPEIYEKLLVRGSYVKPKSQGQ